MKHLQELRRQKNSVNLNKNGPNAPESLKQHFNTGYKACAAEVSRYLESMPFPTNQGISNAFGANLMSHLGKQLQGIEMELEFVISDIIGISIGFETLRHVRFIRL